MCLVSVTLCVCVFMLVEMTGSWAKTKSIRTMILNQEKYFNSSEISMAKAILSWLPYEKCNVDTVCFFEELRARNLKSHKVHARFALTIFEMVGATYSKL